MVMLVSVLLCAVYPRDVTMAVRMRRASAAAS